MNNFVSVNVLPVTLRSLMVLFLFVNFVISPNIKSPIKIRQSASAPIKIMLRLSLSSANLAIIPVLLAINQINVLFAAVLSMLLTDL
jgi:hypothetical protein